MNLKCPAVGVGSFLEGHPTNLRSSIQEQPCTQGGHSLSRGSPEPFRGPLGQGVCEAELVLAGVGWSWELLLSQQGSCTGSAALLPLPSFPCTVCCMLKGVSHLFYYVLNTFLPNVVYFLQGKERIYAVLVPYFYQSSC